MRLEIEASSPRAAKRIQSWVFGTYGVALLVKDKRILSGIIADEMAVIIPALLCNVRDRYPVGYVQGSAKK